MNKRIAILDLGTNTFHLLIADIAEAKLQGIVFQKTIAVKLGEGGITAGLITKKAFDRGIAALKKFQNTIEHYRSDQVKAVATSAIRGALNGDEFIKKVKSETGISLNIINGDQEAELIYKGVRAGVKMGNDIALIMDIGGGSVEFIICNDQLIFWKRSYPIGAARLMALFHHSDPISEKDTQALHHFLDQTLTDLKQQLAFYQPSLLIGSAGAFETFTELADPKFHLVANTFEKSEFMIELKQFKKVAAMLLKSTHAERTQMPAITQVRVDMIVVATLLTKYILDSTQVKSLKLSTYSLKEGILFDLMM